MKKTPWFDPEVKPVHAGVYELQDLPYPFHYWDGAAWFGAGENASDPDAKRMDVMHYEGSYISRHRWRGLTAPAKEGK